MCWVWSPERELIARDRIRVLGFQKAIEIVGEAAKASRGDEVHALDHIKWSGLIGLRNVVVHQYDRVELSRLLDIVDVEFPRLVAQLRLVVGGP